MKPENWKEMIVFLAIFNVLDPSKEVTIQLDGNDIIVPQGKPISTKLNHTSFYQSEYLVYKESQCRIRYLLKFKMF